MVLQKEKEKPNQATKVYLFSTFILYLLIVSLLTLNLELSKVLSLYFLSIIIEREKGEVGSN